MADRQKQKQVKGGKGSPPAAGQETAPTDHAEKKPSTRIEIPLISVPDDKAEIEQEMEELFNEEKVKHRHGGTEPERD